MTTPNYSYLDERREDKDEADDDERVHGGGVGHLGLPRPAHEADLGDGEHGGDAQAGATGHVGLDDPEAHPGAEDDKEQGGVDLVLTEGIMYHINRKKLH